MAKTPKYIGRYLQIAETGKIVRCVCYDDKTVTIEMPKGQIAEVKLDQVVPPPVEAVNLFLSQEIRG